MPVRQLAETEGYRAPDASERIIQFLVDPETTSLTCMKMGATTLSSGHATHVAVHEREEIYLVLGGAGWVDLGGERTSVGPGCVIAIASNEPHQIGAGESDLTYIWVSSDPPAEVAERVAWQRVPAPRSPLGSIE